MIFSAEMFAACDAFHVTQLPRGTVVASFPQATAARWNLGESKNVAAARVPTDVLDAVGGLFSLRFVCDAPRWEAVVARAAFIARTTWSASLVDHAGSIE